MQKQPVRTLVTLCALTALPISAHAQEAWASHVTCLVTAPSATGEPTLSLFQRKITQKDGTSSIVSQVRIKTDSEVVASGTKFEGAKITIDQSDFANLSGSGSANNLVALAIPSDSEILPAIRRGNNISVTIPSPSGEKSYSFSLTGSGKAASSLAACG